MTRIVFVALFVFVASTAQAGVDSYQFVKECTFRSTVIGDVKVALYKDPVERDRAIMIKSTAAPAPMIFDDLDKQYSAVCGVNFKKVVFTYNVANVTTVKFYENPNDFAFGRLKIFYRTPSGSSCESSGCGYSHEASEEIVETAGCVAMSSF